jgi:hypothetical protein
MPRLRRPSRQGGPGPRLVNGDAGQALRSRSMASYCRSFLFHDHGGPSTAAPRSTSSAACSRPSGWPRLPHRTATCAGLVTTVRPCTVVAPKFVRVRVHMADPACRTLEDRTLAEPLIRVLRISRRRTSGRGCCSACELREQVMSFPGEPLRRFARARSSCPAVGLLIQESPIRTADPYNPGGVAEGDDRAAGGHLSVGRELPAAARLGTWHDHAQRFRG